MKLSSGLYFLVFIGLARSQGKPEVETEVADNQRVKSNVTLDYEGQYNQKWTQSKKAICSYNCPFTSYMYLRHL